MSCQPVEVPSRSEAPSAIPLRAGWTRIRPRSSRPNAAAAAGAAAAATPSCHPSPHQRHTEKQIGRRKRGGLRRPGPRAREGAQLRSTPPKRCRASQLRSRSRSEALVPSRCEPGALESDPVARDPTRPQQPAPQQRPRPPSPATTKNKPAAKRGGLRRPGPRAREGAQLRSTPPKTRVVPAS